MSDAVIYGPTWKRDGEGKVIIPPQRSLGWRGIEWCEQWLLQPDGPRAGEPWQFTKEQKRFFCWWYALDEAGHFVYRTGTLRRSKGTGKNPFVMAMSMFEFVGPCRPTGKVDSRGFPVGEPHWAAWVQTAAVNLSQTRNATTLIPSMLSRSAIEEYTIDVGKEKSYAQRGRCLMEAVTSSPKALEGNRITFVVMDETHQWQRSNEGHAMADVISRNATKSRDGAARRLAITNAHAPGEDSVAEHDFDAWRKVEAGLAAGADILYDSLEAPDLDLADDDAVKHGIELARGDANWLNPDRILAEIRDPRTPPGTARRFYLNQIIAEEDKPFDRERWLQLANPDYRVPKDARITLGFDGSVTRDHTALVGTEVATGFQWLVGYWIPERMSATGELEIDRSSVDQTIDYAFETWDVLRMNADPHKWGKWIGDWQGRHSDKLVKSWDTTKYKAMAVACAEYAQSIRAGDVTNDGDPRFAAAIANSHKHMIEIRDDDGERMWYIQKERPDSPLKMDAAEAAILSWEGRTWAVSAGPVKEVVWATV